MTETERLAWGALEDAVRKSDIAKVKSGEISLEDAQRNGRRRVRAAAKVGLTPSQAYRAMVDAQCRDRNMSIENCMASALMKPGTLVRFNHERDGGPVRRVASVAPDGMVELEDMGGFFAPHLFEIADDIADIPPLTAFQRE